MQRGHGGIVGYQSKGRMFWKLLETEGLLRCQGRHVTWSQCPSKNNGSFEGGVDHTCLLSEHRSTVRPRRWGSAPLRSWKGVLALVFPSWWWCSWRALSQPERSSLAPAFHSLSSGHAISQRPHPEREKEAIQVICSQADALQESAYGQQWYFYQDVK